MFNVKRIGTALILSVLLPSVGWAEFVASPMELHLDVGAGTQGSVEVTITNTGRQPLTLKLYLGDSKFHPDGKEENLPPGSVPRSCATWVMLGQQLVDLAPKETQQVRVGLEIPEDATGTYWAKLYIEEMSVPEPTTRQVGDRTYRVFLVQRAGIRIFENVPGTTQPDARVTLVSPEEREDGAAGVLVSVENAGNMLLRCDGRVELRDSGGGVVETLLLGSDGEFWIYPGAKRDLFAPLKSKLPPGACTALAIVDFGGDHLVAGDAVLPVAEGSVDGYVLDLRKSEE